MRHVITIDPGLDVTGVAVWDLDQRHGPNMELSALAALVGSFDVSTDPADRIEQRLAELYDDTVSLVGEFEPVLLYLEAPAFEGDYVGTANRSSVNRYFEARGAILAALGTHPGRIPVIQERAGTSTKEYRVEVLEKLLAISGHTLPTGPQGGKREDQVDAIWIGYWALTTRVEEDLRELVNSAAISAAPVMPPSGE